jgi:hypothetical protein
VEVEDTNSPMISVAWVASLNSFPI